MLGFTFLGFQAYEYIHAYSELNLKLTTGVYGSTFFMLTGFHGVHVTIGAIMLTVMLVRVLKGHFDAGAPFRVRGGRVVLALRRRRLAAAVRPGVLALIDAAQAGGSTPRIALVVSCRYRRAAPGRPKPAA